MVEYACTVRSLHTQTMVEAIQIKDTISTLVILAYAGMKKIKVVANALQNCTELRPHPL